MPTIQSYQPWPPFSTEYFKPSSHLVYMCVQIIGKLMSTQPPTPHWANLAMPMTSRGFTTGTLPYAAGTFSVDMDCIDHTLLFTSSWGQNRSGETGRHVGRAAALLAFYEESYRAFAELANWDPKFTVTGEPV
jgi:hypothetical protein